MRTGFDTLVTTPLDMSLNTTPCVSCGRCAETCPTGGVTTRTVLVFFVLFVVGRLQPDRVGPGRAISIRGS